MKNYAETIIIGAGLTGLTSAFYLKRKGKDFLVLEENDRYGGVIRTWHENGFTYETGPNTGVIGHPEVAELFEDLDGLCRCEIAGKNVRKRFILKNGEWEPMPMGPVDAIRTPLFSTKDKFRILAEPLRRKGSDPEEFLSQMVKRRLGESFLNYAVDPFILGVYAGDPSKLVTRYAFPKLYNLEQNYGSFIGGSVRKMLEKKDIRERKATRKVFSAYGGLSNLTGALYEASGEENFLMNVKGIRIIKEKDHFVTSFGINGESVKITSQKVITTTGAYTLRSLFPGIDEDTLSAIEKVKYARVIQVTLGFKKWSGININGFGGLVPFTEKRDILGVLFISSLLEDRAPEGSALFSVFLGGIRREDIFEKSDEEIYKVVEREFRSIMKLRDFSPDLFRITRYQHSIPQYGIESRKKLESIGKLQSEMKGLIIGGNILDGIGMSDRIKQGRRLSDIV